MNKSQAVKRAGSQKALATLLGLTPQAVSAWQDEHIPPLQVYRLRELRPDWFAARKRRRKTPTMCGYCDYEESNGELIAQCKRCKAADAKGKRIAV